MSDSYECDICGLAESDLPDGMDDEMIEAFFDGARVVDVERNRSRLLTWCVVHDEGDVLALLASMASPVEPTPTPEEI